MIKSLPWELAAKIFSVIIVILSLLFTYLNLEKASQAWTENKIIEQCFNELLECKRNYNKDQPHSSDTPPPPPSE